MKYTQYEFFTSDDLERDWLISILTHYNFEGFEETENSLKSFIPNDKVNGVLIKEVLYDNELNHIEFTKQELDDINWNEEWEKNFEPVTIAKKVGIRAPFHKPLGSKYEIIIEPKMSFGTGHHATTASVVELMLKTDFKDKSVLDFGSGTGILAILAEKLKAAKVLAIDNEEWAYNNCLETTAKNGNVNIQCVRGDEGYTFTEKYDVILANINRNVILANLKFWKGLLNKGGILIVSGILVSDEADIIAEAEKNGLRTGEILSNNGWMAIAFQPI